MSRDSKEALGSPVVDGVTRYFSVSGLEKGDPRSKGCWQRYYRRRVMHQQEPTTDKKEAQKKKGDDLVHKPIEQYLLTGQNVLSPIVLKSMNLVPKPGPGLLLEQPLHSVAPDGTINSVLHAAGVPFVGYIDMLNLRGDTVDEYGDPDPPDTIEVNDWKLKGNAKDRNGNSILPHPAELIRTIQMLGYGEAARLAFPGTKNVRISHTCFIEKGDESKRITRLHVVDEFREGWKYVEGIARTAIEIVREPDLTRVPYNQNACEAYGGCPWREQCPGYQKTSLDNMWNKVASDFKDTDMGLLTNLPPQQPQQETQPATQWNTLQGAPQSNFVPPAQPDMRAQLAQEEALLRQQQVQQQAQMQPAPQMTVVTAWQKVQTFGRGAPTLVGAAARAIYPDTSATAAIHGAGQLAAINLSDPAHIFQLLAELEAQGAPAAPVNVPPPPPPVQSMGILSPDAPSSVPALAAQMPQQPPPLVQGNTYVQTPSGPVQITDGSALNTATVAEGEAPKRRGRPKKNQEPVGGATQTTTSAPSPAVTQVPAANVMPAANLSTGSAFPVSDAPLGIPSYPQNAQSEDETKIYIDCRPYGVITRPLDDLLDALNRELANRYCRDAQGNPTIQDIRAAPKDSVLAYGGWKGAVTAIVRDKGVGPGAWHLDCRNDELRSIFADALRIWAGANGADFTQGVR